MVKRQVWDNFVDTTKEASIFERVWLKLFPPTFCANPSCGKEITKKEVRQFNSQCEDCWYETQKERGINELPLELLK